MSEISNIQPAAQGPWPPLPNTGECCHDGGASGGAERGFASGAEPEAPPATRLHDSSPIGFVARNPDPVTSIDEEQDGEEIASDEPLAASFRPPLSGYGPGPSRRRKHSLAKPIVPAEPLTPGRSAWRVNASVAG